MAGEDEEKDEDEKERNEYEELDSQIMKQILEDLTLEEEEEEDLEDDELSPLDDDCLLYTSPSPRDQRGSRMPSSA